MADPLDEIRRDLFHAEGDKVCNGRLIRRHVPALLNEVERLRGADEVIASWQQIANDARAEMERLCEALDEAVDVFRNHDCPQSHLAPECHLCEVVDGADRLLHGRTEATWASR